MQSRTLINQKCIGMAANASSLSVVMKYAFLCQPVGVYTSFPHTKGPNTTLFLSIDFCQSLEKSGAVCFYFKSFFFYSLFI